MRFMMLVKASQDSEASVLPSRELVAEMGRYNEELVKAGVMFAGEGLHASSKGARIKYSKDQRTVTDGPFTETKELIAGFWLIQVASKEEAIEWASRVPFEDGEVAFARQDRPGGRAHPAARSARVFIHSWAPYDATEPWGADPEGIVGVITALGGEHVQLAHAEADFEDPAAPRWLVTVPWSASDCCTRWSSTMPAAPSVTCLR